MPTAIKIRAAKLSPFSRAVLYAYLRKRDVYAYFAFLPGHVPSLPQMYAHYSYYGELFDVFPSCEDACLYIVRYTKPSAVRHAKLAFEAYLLKQREEDFIVRTLATCLCPLTQQLMMQPVMAPDGVTYEKENLRAWTRAHGSVSPVTGTHLLGGVAEGGEKRNEDERDGAASRVDDLPKNNSIIALQCALADLMTSRKQGAGAAGAYAGRNIC